MVYVDECVYESDDFVK